MLRGPSSPASHEECQKEEHKQAANAHVRRRFDMPCRCLRLQVSFGLKLQVSDLVASALPVATIVQPGMTDAGMQEQPDRAAAMVESHGAPGMSTLVRKLG
jgi:hypothetical protein